MEANSIKDLLFSSLTHLPNDLKCKFSMILWSIWKNRNEKVWNNLDISPATSISLSDQFYSEWSHARRKSNNIPSLPAQQVHGTWEPPPLGYITCNVAIFQDINAFGADLCIRGHDMMETLFDQKHASLMANQLFIKQKDGHYSKQFNGYPNLISTTPFLSRTANL